MSKSKETKQIGLFIIGISIFYIISMFVLGGSDSAYFNKKNAAIARQVFALALIFSGGWMAYWFVGLNNIREAVDDIRYSSSEEQLLDNTNIEEDIKRNKFDNAVSLGVIGIHMGIGLFFFIGEWIGYSYAVVQVFAFVYAMFCLIIGWMLVGEFD